MQTIVVLAGGASPERDVSLWSGAAVAHALQTAGYTVSVLDPADDQEKLLAVTQKADVVFPVLHGAGGEDGSIQLLLEKHQIPFVGSGSATSRLCFNKHDFKAFLERNDFPTPEGETVTFEQFTSHPLAEKPFVLKPYDGGSSIDTFIVRDPKTNNTTAIREAFDRHPTMLLETLIAGQEITVGVLGSQALPVVEIVPPENQEFDFANKYNGSTKELCPPVSISAELQEQAQALALSVHERAGCAHFSRTDIIIDADQKLWILETNTIPGFTEQSLFPKSAAAHGLSMETWVARIIDSLSR